MYMTCKYGRLRDLCDLSRQVENLLYVYVSGSPNMFMNLIIQSVLLLDEKFVADWEVGYI